MMNMLFTQHSDSQCETMISPLSNILVSSLIELPVKYECSNVRHITSSHLSIQMTTILDRKSPSGICKWNVWNGMCGNAVFLFFFMVVQKCDGVLFHLHMSLHLDICLQHTTHMCMYWHVWWIPVNHTINSFPTWCIYSLKIVCCVFMVEVYGATEPSTRVLQSFHLT